MVMTMMMMMTMVIHRWTPGRSGDRSERERERGVKRQDVRVRLQVSLFI